MEVATIRFGSILLALFAALPAVAQSDGAIVCEGKQFVIEVLPGGLSTELAKQVANEAEAAAAATWPLLEKQLQARVGTRPKIVLHCEAASFRVVERTSCNLKWLVEDFVLADGSVAHVLPWPPLEEDVIPLVGLPDSARQAVQRCAVQLVALQRSETAQADPWLAEIVGFGLLEEIVNPRRAGGVDPAFDMRRFNHRHWAREGYADNLFDRLMVVDPAKDRQEYDLRRETSAVIAGVLAEANGSWARKLLAKPPKPLGVAANRQAVFESILGKDRTKAQVRWDQARRKLAPVWVSRGNASSRDGKLLLVGAPGHSTFLGPLAPPPPGDYAICGRFCMAEVGSEAFCVELDLGDKPQLGVWLLEGEVRIETWTPESKKWGKQICVGKAPIPLNVAFDLRIELGKELRVLVGGTEVCKATIPDRTWRGNWRVAPHTTVVWIENLRAEPLVPAKK